MREWLYNVTPAWAEPGLTWVLRPEVIVAVTLASVFLFVASVVAIPWLVARLPVDYFQRPRRDRTSLIEHPRLRFGFHVAKNILGAVLLLAGIAMLVLPGQGMLTIIVSLVLLEFPGKRRLQRRIVSRPRILGALNAIRRRAGREPLVVD